MKQIRCPYCQKNITQADYSHDESSNIICNTCKKIIFATCESSEVELIKLYTKQSFNSSSHTTNGGGGGSGHRTHHHPTFDHHRNKLHDENIDY